MHQPNDPADLLTQRVAELERELAEAREDAANLIRQTTPIPIVLDPYERGKFDGRMYAIEQLEGLVRKGDVNLG